MAKNAWLAVPIAVVVLHRLAWGAGATTATATLLTLAAGTFAALFTLGLILRRLGVRSPMVGVVLAALFWLSAPTLAFPDWIGGAGIEPDPITLGSSGERRDLIVIMVDDHPSSQALLLDHGYDNAEFELDLFERGLQVAPEAWSNSSDPLLAVASALSGRYPGTPHNERDRRRLAAMAEGDNPVADLLRENGYTTTHLGAPSAVATWFGGPNEGGAVGVDEVGQAVDTAVDTTTPDFAFAHIGDCDTEAAVTAAAFDAVVARAVCNNRLIIEILDHLDHVDHLDHLDHNVSTDPVVVIAGTRGAAIDGDLGDNPDAWPRSAIIRGLGVFSAIRFATDCERPPDDATVAVIVHYAVACALGVDPDPAMERAVVIKGGPVDPDGEREVNLNVLRSSLAGQNSRTSR